VLFNNSTASCRRTPAARCLNPSRSSSPTRRVRRRSAVPRTPRVTVCSVPEVVRDLAACRRLPLRRRWPPLPTCHRPAARGLCPTQDTRSIPPTGSGKLPLIERHAARFFSKEFCKRTRVTKAVLTHIANGTVTRQKYDSDEVLWGEFLRVVVTGEYNVPYCWPFSGTDAYPPQTINQTNISAHSCNPSEQRFFKTSNLAINNSLVRNPPQAGKA